MAFVAALVAQWERAACQCRTGASNPGSGTSPGEGHGTPLQHSCLGNPMDRGAWQATVSVQFSSVWSSVKSKSLQPHELQHARLHYFLSFTISQSLLKLMSLESVMRSNHLILCCSLLLLLSIFPRLRVFSDELMLHIRWPKYWRFSNSPSNVNIQG